MIGFHDLVIDLNYVFRYEKMGTRNFFYEE